MDAKEQLLYGLSLIHLHWILTFTKVLIKWVSEYILGEKKTKIAKGWNIKAN